MVKYCYSINIFGIVLDYFRYFSVESHNLCNFTWGKFLAINFFLYVERFASNASEAIETIVINKSDHSSIIILPQPKDRSKFLVYLSINWPRIQRESTCWLKMLSKVLSCYFQFSKFSPPRIPIPIFNSQPLLSPFFISNA